MRVYECTYGIPKPDKEPTTTQEMRAAMNQAERDCNILHAARCAAFVQGLSGEDMYTVIAYRALRELERTHRLLLQQLECNLNVMPIFAKPVTPKEQK
jgi:hypothetical protein